MELADDLDAFVIDADRWPEPDEALEPPRDAERANAMLRGLRLVERELEKIDRLAAEEVARIEAWRDDRTAGLVARRRQVTEALEQWMRAVNRDDPKRKSENLPNGKVQLRKPSAGTVEVTDAKAFEKWWREERTHTLAAYLRDLMDADADAIAAEVLELVLTRSELMRLKPEPNKTALKEFDVVPGPVIDGEQLCQLRNDDELIPGVALHRRTADTFSVTVA